MPFKSPVQLFCRSGVSQEACLPSPVGAAAATARARNAAASNINAIDGHERAVRSMFSSLLEPPVCSKVMSPVEYRSHSGRVHIVQCYARRAGRLDRVAASRHVEAEVQ